MWSARATWRTTVPVISLGVSALLAAATACESSATSNEVGIAVDLRNFAATPVSMLRDGEAAAAGTLVPARGGTRRVVVPNNGIGSRTAFSVVSAGRTLATVSCTATINLGRSVHPTVAWQQTARLDCLDW